MSRNVSAALAKSLLLLLLLLLLLHSINAFIIINIRICNADHWFMLSSNFVNLFSGLIWCWAIHHVYAVSVFQQTSTVAKAREIIHKDGIGLRGLNKGVTATMARNGVFNMIYFSFYHNMKPFIPKNTVCFVFLAMLSWNWSSWSWRVIITRCG